MTFFPHPPYISVSPIEIKLKGRNYDTTEVSEAELQAVLNTLTEHDFRNAFKKMQKRFERFIRAEEDCLGGDGGL
jgi:hypothetical protein